MIGSSPSIPTSFSNASSFSAASMICGRQNSWTLTIHSAQLNCPAVVFMRSAMASRRGLHTRMYKGKSNCIRDGSPRAWKRGRKVSKSPITVQQSREKCSKTRKSLEKCSKTNRKRVTRIVQYKRNFQTSSIERQHHQRNIIRKQHKKHTRK